MVRPKTIEELNNLSKAEYTHSTDKTPQRSKRPVRLLPRRVLLGKKKDDDDEPPIRRPMMMNHQPTVQIYPYWVTL